MTTRFLYEKWLSRHANLMDVHEPLSFKLVHCIQISDGVACSPDGKLWGSLTTREINGTIVRQFVSQDTRPPTVYTVGYGFEPSSFLV